MPQAAQKFSNDEIVKAFRSVNPGLKGVPDDQVLKMVMAGAPPGGPTELPGRAGDTAQAKPQYTHVEIPGYEGGVDFPATMSQADIDKAAGELYDQKAPKWKDLSSDPTFAGLSGVDPSTLGHRLLGAVANITNSILPSGDTRSARNQPAPMTPEEQTGSDVMDMVNMGLLGTHGLSKLMNVVDIPGHLMGSAADIRAMGQQLPNLPYVRSLAKIPNMLASGEEGLARLLAGEPFSGPPGPMSHPTAPEFQPGFETPGPIQRPTPPPVAEAGKMRGSAQWPPAPSTEKLNISRPSNPFEAVLEQMRQDVNAPPDLTQREATPAGKQIQFKRAGVTKKAMIAGAEKISQGEAIPKAEGVEPPNPPVGRERTKVIKPEVPHAPSPEFLKGTGVAEGKGTPKEPEPPNFMKVTPKIKGKAGGK